MGKKRGDRSRVAENQQAGGMSSVDDLLWENCCGKLHGRHELWPCDRLYFQQAKSTRTRFHCQVTCQYLWFHIVLLCTKHGLCKREFTVS